jgi:hypothetical protein
MASAALIDDQLQIDGVNMYTATRTFGVPTNGFYKTPMDGTYTTQIDDSGYDSEGGSSVSNLDEHFNPLHLNRSGSAYLKTGTINPAPEALYPARRIQYDNGRVSYSYNLPDIRKRVFTEPTDWILVALVLGVLVFTVSRVLKK